VQVAFDVDIHVDEGMPGELVEHVIEEADAGRYPGLAGAVDIDGNGNRSLVGLARDGARAARCGSRHGSTPKSSACSLSGAVANIQKRASKQRGDRHLAVVRRVRFAIRLRKLK